MNNYFQKIFILFFIIVLLPTFTLADDILEIESIDDIPILSIESSSSISKIPNINARHAVVIDRNSNYVLYGKKEKEKCKMASTTKIMTALIVLENSSLSDIVVISKKAANTGGSRLGLFENDKISISDLLYGLMLCSGNDAAVALAEQIGKTVENFACLMNKKANELNLSSTHFVTPHGLDEEGHYTTAYDLAILTNYALKNKSFFDIVGTKFYTIHINGMAKNIKNTNELLNVLDGVYGVKTGFTNGANRCLVSSCKRNELDIICVVLGCDTKKNRTQDSISLINYVFQNFTVVNIEDIIDNDFKAWSFLHTNSFCINKGVSQKLNLKIDKTSLIFSKIAIKNDCINKIRTQIKIDFFHESPLKINSIIGNISLIVDDKTYLSLNIINTNSVDRKDVLLYLHYFLSNYYTYFKNGI